MKKVLIVGPEFYDYNLSVARAFTDLGFETKVLGYSAGTVTSFGERVRYHLASDKKKFFEKSLVQFNDEVISVYNTFMPDLVFIIHGGVLFPGTMKKIDRCKKVLWLMDSLSRGTEISPFMMSLDHIFFFEKTDVDYLWGKAAIKSYFLPLAVDPNVYYPMETNKDIDILFVGALYDNRMEMLQRMADVFKDKVIKIYGNYYSPLRRPVHHLFRKTKNIFLNRNISPSQVNTLYNRSKVCLNIHHSQSKFGVNQRFFEISGSKAFQLVERKGYITENFSENEIMTYTNETDMLEKIDHALKNYEHTKQMANRAYVKVTSAHTFTHRIQQVLDSIQ